MLCNVGTIWVAESWVQLSRAAWFAAALLLRKVAAVVGAVGAFSTGLRRPAGHAEARGNALPLPRVSASVAGA